VLLTVNRKLTPAEVAEAFCELNDEEQAQVFIDAARIAGAWPVGNGQLGPDWQWHKIGRHLRDCECSTIEARDMIASIAQAIEDKTTP
jgi:hypothetical protein